MSTFFFRKPPLLRLSRLSTNLNDYRPTWESYSSNCCRKVGSFWAVALAGFLGASCQCIHGKEVNTALEDTRIAGPIENAPTIEVKSNIHTAKWRVYTDTGRERFSQGKLKEAEQYFLQAIEEAKQGFGEEDAHVASSLNNLAELYKTQKQYEKAEPLYLEAIERLKMSMGSEHQSVAFVLHNLAGINVLQRNLDKAKEYYEHALKIKGKALGSSNPDYADTMFQLGKVLQQMGSFQEAEALIRESIQILEGIGAGHSQTALRYMSSLAEILVTSRQLVEAENLQRKILHTLELSQGPEALSTLRAAEKLADILLSLGKLDESEEILKRCLQIWQSISNDNFRLEIWMPCLSLAYIALLHGDESVAQGDKDLALIEYDKAEALSRQALSIAEHLWNKFHNSMIENASQSRTSNKNLSSSPFFLALIRSLNTLGLVLVRLAEANQESMNGLETWLTEAEMLLNRCLSFFKESDYVIPQVKEQHAKCLEYLVAISNLRSKITS